MGNVRLIARLDVKGPNLIKGIHLEGLRKVGNPHDYAQRYYQAGVDELLYMDIVASLYGRNGLCDLVQKAAENIFIPITVGGGIRSIVDIEQMLRCGADKVAINTAAIHRPALISDAARRFGSQCVVLSIEAKRTPSGTGWLAFTDNGREHTGRDVVDWAREATELGAGEILLTSIDREGTRKGFDLDLVRTVSDAVNVPVITSGGMGAPDHLIDVVKTGRADAVAMADILHYGRMPYEQIRAAALTAGIPVRTK